MLTADRLRSCRCAGDVIALVRELGYDVAPVEIDPLQWRRAGVAVPWGGDAGFRLLTRMRRFDLFFVAGGERINDEAAGDFLRSYHIYNVLIKSCIIVYRNCQNRISVYDLSARRQVRRLDVDLDAPTPHSLDRLNLLHASESPAELPRVFDLALDRENVTRRFFQRFRDEVHATTQELAAAFPLAAADAVASQALLILSRLLFLCFIQEKGWLNAERRFLFDRLRLCLSSHEEFYAAVLTPLFFGCLNTPLEHRAEEAGRLGRIPYLNGGLFEPSSFERHWGDLHLSNERMRHAVEELFEHFDFSSDERDLAGAHVDPEMLGKVFESLMATEERAATGSFYTPRAIVDVLTARAIADWLADGNPELRTMIDAAARSAAVPAAGPAASRRRCAGEDACEPAGGTPTLRPSTASGLLRRLEAITILDPACGSGAFLLSALGVIERLTHSLAAVAGEDVRPDLRQHIVEHSLFGVDMKPEAVRLCELRLWLGIVSPIDRAIEDVRPLPNLDRNIMQGNSLLSPTDFLGDGRGDVYREWVYALRAQGDLVNRYRHASRDERPALARVIRDNDRRLAADLLTRALDADTAELQRLSLPEQDLFGRTRALDLQRCRELHERIDQNRRSLARTEDGVLDFFSYDIHFAHVMSGGGFSVVLGNPPWVRTSRIDRRDKLMYAERYALFRGDELRGHFHQPDLSLAFAERALSLAAPGGVVALLLPAKIANAGYAAPLRRAASRHSIVALDDWSAAARQHFDADTFPLGVTIARRLPSSTIITDGEESFSIPQHAVSVDGCGSEWALLPPDVAAILRRLREKHPLLAAFLGRAPVMGVKTGDNSLFFMGEATVRGNRVVSCDGIAIPAAAVVRCVRGRDVRRWNAASSEWMLWPPRDGWRTAPQWLKRFAASRGADATAIRLAFVKPEHIGIKVVWKDVSRGMAAAVVGDREQVGRCSFPIVPNQTLYSLDAGSAEEAHAMAALLNSTVADALLLATAERAKDAHFRYFGRTVAGMPLPALARGGEAWLQLSRFGRRAQRGDDVACDLDALVASLYGVSDGELRILRMFVDRRLAREAC